ncbi:MULTISPECIES: SseB family protein [unclassified Micromonospora]|uniref:SseB family protein n=1 Tax=unclassified Micromonospora TaxID=2617518 RepID=UPI002FF42B2D
MTDWEPATEAETAMRDALHANDQELYFRILAGTELLLPVSAQALAGEAPMGWGTWTTGGRTHVLAFTSDAALRACLGATAGPSRRAPYTELAATWPNHEWWLAVNPGLPVEGYLPAWFVSQLSRGDVRLPGRTMGARARLEQVESLTRDRAEGTGPAPATRAPDPATDARAQPRPMQPPTAAIGAGPDASTARPGVPGPPPARPSAAPYRPESHVPRPAGGQPVVPAAASYPEAVPADGGARPGGEPRPPADPVNGRPAAAPPSDRDGTARQAVPPWMASPRRRLLGEGLGARPSTDGGPPNGRSSFFEPASERGAAARASRDPLRAGERAAPAPRPGLGGQAFPRRRPATSRPGEEQTRAFQFDRSEGPPPPADRRADPLAEEPTRAFRVPAPDAEATQALPRRQPVPEPPSAPSSDEEQTQRLPDPSARSAPPAAEELPVSIAEPVSAPPAPRRGFTPIVIEGTVIASRDLPVTPEPDPVPPATVGPDAGAARNGTGGFASSGAAGTAFPRSPFAGPSTASADDRTEPIPSAPEQRADPVFPAPEQRTEPVFTASELRTEPIRVERADPVFPAPEQRTQPPAPVSDGPAAPATPGGDGPTEPFAAVPDDRTESLFTPRAAPVSPAFDGRSQATPSSPAAPVSPAFGGRPEATPSVSVSPAFGGRAEGMPSSPAAPGSPAFGGRPEATPPAPGSPAFGGRPEAAPPTGVSSATGGRVEAPPAAHAAPTFAAPPVDDPTPPNGIFTAGGGVTAAETSARAAEAFQPANSVEEDLLDAAGSGSTDTFLSTLLLARVLLPVAPDSTPGSRPGDPGFVWRTEELDGEPYVVVHTSPERLADHCPEPVETVEVRFVQLIRRWPDEAWSFAVNPGSPVGAKLPGEQIVGLANWAAEVGLGDEVEAEPEPVAAEEPAERTRYAPQVTDPTRPVTMQKAVAPSQLAYYLERGYDRVSGFVHRANELAHLNSPAQLHDALGLGYPDSPFARDADRIYVLRWPAYRPSLYRIPYGGQNEAAMRAMEGWVIERPPFRGNGFAPGDSSEVVAEFKVDSARLPHGAQLWRIGADGTERVIALLDSDALLWRQVGEP